MNQRGLFTMLALVALPFLLWAQTGTITGTVTESATGDALPGANVVVEGTSLGAAADADGYFTIASVPAGDHTVTASVIGYVPLSQMISIVMDETVTIDFGLEPTAIALSALEVLASRATRETPVAYTNVEKTDMELRLGSRDIPLVLNTTPSVYATQQGGGAGDARVNVRGFNQRNVAVMINGVPVNDMENGWVYWSNWDGVADATSSIQLQRGLSAVNLAAPSIGGTMNIITDPTARKAGGLFKQEYGSGMFLKTTINYNTGLIGDKLAMSGTIVRKTGDGLIDKTWTDAWAYYFGLSYAMNSKNRFEFYALGAPQRHGQMRYAQNIAAYDQEYAKEVFDDELLAIDVNGNDTSDVFEKLDYYDVGLFGHGFPEDEEGRLYNENWNTISSDYTGKQYFYMYGHKEKDRHDPDFLNESENYYHKPQVNLNWYLTLNEKMRLSSVFYFSGGSGGGTGTFGDLVWDYGGPSRIADWDATIAVNESAESRKGYAKPEGEAVGFLRNSINRQWTLGAISKLNYDLSEALKLQIGVDWRTAYLEHKREVRDLLGGDYAVNGDYENKETGDARYSTLYNEFDDTIEDAKVGLGDFIDYNNDNTVDWIGFFGQGEYKTSMYSLYGMAGFSMVKYTLVDHFKKAENWDFDYVTATDDGEVMIEADWISAIQFKAGGLYKVADNLDVFGNFGYVEKVPIFDNIIDDTEIALAPDPTNEKFISTEFGVNASLMMNMAIKLNVYLTNWLDRNMVKPVSTGQGTSGDTDLIFITGMDQNHKGVELELAYQPMKLLRLDAAVSLGQWVYTDDAEGTYKWVDLDSTADYTYSVKDLMVGAMPQTIFSLSATVFPIDGLRLVATLNYYDRFWADWDPVSREVQPGEEPDRAENWQVPAYSKLNLHGYYNLPFDFGGVKLQAFFHMFNALDAIYVQDALDNSEYNSFLGDNIDAEAIAAGEAKPNHKADDAEVYLGMPRNFNVGLSVRF